MARKKARAVEAEMDLEVEIVDEGNVEPQEREASQGLHDTVRHFVDRLQRLADRRVVQRQPIEDRWVEDLLQYHGRYDHATASRLKSEQNSKLFVNVTGPKTRAYAARLYDMMFPTDDRNWGIKPSPVPELDLDHEERQQAASEAGIALRKAEFESGKGAAPDPSQSPRLVALRMESERLQAFADETQAVLGLAKRQSDLMQAEIEDKLKACRYQPQCRDVIDWASKIGSGIMKGPVTGAKMNARWGRDDGPINITTGKPQPGAWAVKHTADNQPAFIAVDPWSFFPDMDSGPNVADGEGELVRHLMNRKALRALARRPNFDQDAIRRLMGGAPIRALPTYLNELREISGDHPGVDAESWQVWEYSGPVSAEEMRDVSLMRRDADMLGDVEDADPLEEINVCLWFCEGELLYFGPHPMDSGETLYSVFCLEKDETSPFGYGVPYLLRHPQKAINAGWRLMMENAPLSNGPQVVVNRTIIEPEDGDWKLKPRKVWIAKEGLPVGHRAFEIFDIPNRQGDLQAIIELAMRFTDIESGVSQIAQGDQDTPMTKTVGGMAMLQNASNIVSRRAVRNFDDDLTEPNIRRMYHWLMQHSDKDAIKGDYEVDARGSSVLLVRELQQQNLMVLAAGIGTDPEYGMMLKKPEILRKIAGSMLIPADEVVKTDTEIAEVLAQMQQQAAEQAAAGGTPQADPELEGEKLAVMREKMSSEEAVASMKVDADRYVAKLRYDAEMHSVAEALNMKAEDLEAKMQMHREDKASKERIFAGEAAMTMRRDQQADVNAAEDREVKRGEVASKPKPKGGMPSTGGGYV
jgi:hypothetical protein